MTDYFDDPKNPRFKRLRIGKNIPDRVPSMLPDNTIATISHSMDLDDVEATNLLIQDQRTHKKRDWLNLHAYHCLPIVMANQYGFVVKTEVDFWCTWNGGLTKGDVTIRMDDQPRYQYVVTHFGMGLVTIQNRFVLRTKPGVNLLMTPPFNYFIDGITPMSAVIETDNLRRDFTFNLRITRANHEIFVPAGTPIASLVPIPRGYADQYRCVPGSTVLPQDVLQDEHETQLYFSRERVEIDALNPNHNGQRYRTGIDIYGNAFADHQTKINPRRDDATKG